MANLLAILLSLAVMLTGATAPVAEPVSRTLVLSNLSVRHNDEEVELTPYVSLGVQADDGKALLDFFVGNGDEAYLPIQVAIDEDGVLLHTDREDTNVRISAAELEEMMGDVEVDEASEQALTLIGDYMTAYGELFTLMQDKDAMETIQRKAQDIYDEMVDRGEGVSGSAEYDGETFDVVTYEYTLTAAQLGALADAVYTVDERLQDYAQAYFKLLQSMPEDSGLNGYDSFESLLSGFADITMDITESISGEELNITDAIMHITVPRMEAPVEFVIHSVQRGDEKTGELSTNIDVDGTLVSVYMEAVQTGLDMQMTLSLTMNPAAASEETDAALLEEEYAQEIGEDIGDEVDAEYEDDDAEYEDAEALMIDGEGDGEDAVYFTLDFDRVYDEVADSAYDSLGFTLDLAAQDIHVAFSIEGSDDECHLNGEMAVGEDTYGYELDALVSDEPIEDKTDTDKAVSLGELDFIPVLTSLSGDVQKLYNDESVQKLVEQGRAAMEAAASAQSEAYEVMIDDDDDSEDDAADYDDYAMPEPFGTPVFNWLPEGFEVQEISVDSDYPQAECTLINPETDASIYIDISAVLSFAETSDHYVLNEDGSLAPIEGVILNAESGDGYSMYNVDDGTLSISVFPHGDDVTVEDVAHLLTAITFD